MRDDSILVEAEAALRGLKDFQLQTVEHVHKHLYAKGGSRRFLVADEVGLGKTLVARGVVAKAIQELHDKIDRIDVVYICSNADIARQNINRLRIGREQPALATRLTLLPKQFRQLTESKARLNFISFTPATSFDLADGLGHSEERVLLYLLLQELWGLGDRAAPRNVFQGNVYSDKFRAAIDATSLEEFDPSRSSIEALGEVLAKNEAASKLTGTPTPRQRFDELCEAYPQGRSSPGVEIARRRSRFVGELRGMLAASCVKTLEPDIVILDEFQRFSHLLDVNDPETQLARDLFSFPDVRVLLLSATPYKMYTPPGEESGEDHYQDFVRTVRFLEDSSTDRSLESLLTKYREAMMDIASAEGPARLQSVSRELEQRLRRVMVRTERLSSTDDRNGMLVELRSTAPTVTEEDALGYVAMQRIARRVGHHDTIDYWKSAAYPLNFMDSDYALTVRLEESQSEPGERVEVARALRTAGNHRFDDSKIDRRQRLDGGNGRLRALMEQTLDQGAHRLLWLPPSIPYYQMEGAYADPAVAKLTKRLVFTSWRFVPRSIAALLSYEAERRMHGSEVSAGGLLKFGRSEGRLTGMAVLALMYPSSFLARACDPITLGRELGLEPGPTSRIAASDLLESAGTQIELALRHLPPGPSDGPVDERWYWAAPLLLDMRLDPEATRNWFGQTHLAAAWSRKQSRESEAVDEAWEEHVLAAREMAFGKLASPLGRQPEDLAQVLAEFSLGAPGVCLLRSMLRVAGVSSEALHGEAGVRIRTSAAGAAWGFRTLFNQPEVTSLVQHEHPGSGQDTPYWRATLHYGIAGCLQAVLDEYAHVLRDHLGMATGKGDEKAHEIAEHIAQALSLRTSNLAVKDVGASPSGLTFESKVRRMRCHFALRFGDQESETGGVETRADSVRKAFNSPFWPFVLATTSVGQEGLDFHTYCHAVVHWNLPTNPVDLEQREGRVHRYKGHAVRKNVALTHSADALGSESGDIWEDMFSRARAARPPGSTDVLPYWVHAPEGGARIERHVLALPSSREHEQMNRLARSLTLYRMVFGQPRQEDMVRFLMQRVDAAKLKGILEVTRVDLGPDVAEGIWPVAAAVGG
jgi:hypothetical protein